MTQVAIEARVMTKVTAIPILTALPSFLDTPKNGQRPRNLTRMKLLMRTRPRNMVISSFTLHHPRPSEQCHQEAYDQEYPVWKYEYCYRVFPEDGQGEKVEAEYR